MDGQLPLLVVAEQVPEQRPVRAGQHGASWPSHEGRRTLDLDPTVTGWRWPDLVEQAIAPAHVAQMLTSHARTRPEPQTVS